MGRDNPAPTLNEICEPNRRGNADVKSRVTQAEAKRNVRSHIAACAAGEEYDSLRHLLL